MRNRIKTLWVKYNSLIILAIIPTMLLFGISVSPTTKAVTVESDSSYLSTEVSIQLDIEIEKDK